MARPKDATGRNEIIAEYERQVKANGSTTYADVRAAVGGKYQYISLIVKTHRDLKEVSGGGVALERMS